MKREPNCRVCGTPEISLSSGILRCATCRRRRGREHYHRSERYRKKMRDQYYSRTYGVPMSHLEGLFAAQNGRCAICLLWWEECPATKQSRYESVFVQHLYVDHDHQDGRVQGLLCNNCNTAIAFLKEDPHILESAAAYLRKHKDSPDSA